jgi:hypothetical protein
LALLKSVSKVLVLIDLFLGLSSYRAHEGGTIYVLIRKPLIGRKTYHSMPKVLLTIYLKFEKMRFQGSAGNLNNMPFKREMLVYNNSRVSLKALVAET